MDRVRGKQERSFLFYEPLNGINFRLQHLDWMNETSILNLVPIVALKSQHPNHFLSPNMCCILIFYTFHIFFRFYGKIFQINIVNYYGMFKLRFLKHELWGCFLNCVVGNDLSFHSFSWNFIG
jgi:hypothetical protein